MGNCMNRLRRKHFQFPLLSRCQTFACYFALKACIRLRTLRGTERVRGCLRLQRGDSQTRNSSRLRKLPSRRSQVQDFWTAVKPERRLGTTETGSMAQARIGKQELKILLIGKTGSGKSATGNTILGTRKFKSTSKPDSTTRHCEKEQATVGDRRIIVVDTPGFFDTKGEKLFTQQDLKKYTEKPFSGFHAILVVIKADRITKQDQETFQQVKSLFLNEGKNYMILLFTHKDELERNDSTIEEFLADVEGPLKELMAMSKRRFIAFNNMADGKERLSQVKDLIEMIDRLVAANGRTPMYTEEQFNKDLSWGSWFGSFFWKS